MNTAEEQATAEWVEMVEAQPVDSYVYTYRDAKGSVLYVGCTNNLKSRETQHRRTAEWFHLATQRTEVGPYQREIALFHEARAIQREAPLFNSYRTSGYSGPLSIKWYQRASAIDAERRLADPEYGRAQAQQLSDLLAPLFDGTHEPPADLEPIPQPPVLPELRRRRRVAYSP